MSTQYSENMDTENMDIFKSNLKIDTLTKERIEQEEQEEKEKIFKEMLAFKDLDFLLEKKLFYKNQLTYLYDMEMQIEKFKKQINSELSTLQTILFKKCNHDWMQCSDGSYDEHPEYVCVICGSYYR